MRNFSIDQDKFFAGWFKTLWGNKLLVHNPQHPNVAFAKAQPVGTRVSARRWIGILRLHAGKYILGITAPTGTGVQARFPGSSTPTSLQARCTTGCLFFHKQVCAQSIIRK